MTVEAEKGGMVECQDSQRYSHCSHLEKVGGLGWKPLQIKFTPNTSLSSNSHGEV